MFCMKCQNELFQCTCSDLEERLNSAAADNALEYRYCTTCGKHYARCKCKNPTWAIKNSKNAGN